MLITVKMNAEGRGLHGLLHILRFIIALKILLVPLVFDPGSSFTFDLAKTALSHSLAWMMVGVMGLMLLSKHWHWQHRWIHWLVIGFIFSAILSTVFAADHVIAAFGYPRRYLGLTMVLDMGVLYAALVFAIRKLSDYGLIIKSLIAGAILSSLGAIAQILKLDPFAWGPDIRGRIFSAFGNPDFYGQYIAVLAIVLLGVFVFKPLKTLPRALLILLFLAVLYLMGLVGTRSALIGLGAGVLTIMILWMKRTKVPLKTFLKVIGVFLAGSFLIGTFLSQTILGEKLSSYWIRRGISQRTIIYETALRAWADHPIIGVGPDNLGVVFFRYRSPREQGMRGPYYVDTSAHGWPFNILTAQGLLGFVIFLSILGVTARTSWKLATGPYGVGASIAAAGLAGYFGAGLLTPDHISTEWIGWTGIGILSGLGQLAEAKENQDLAALPLKPKWRIPIPLSAIIMLGLMTMGIFFSIKPWIASRMIVPALGLNKDSEAQRLFKGLVGATRATEWDPLRAPNWTVRAVAEEWAGNLPEALASYEEAVRLAPYEPARWWDLSRINLRLLNAGDLSRKEAVLKAIKKGLETDPYGAESHVTAAKNLLLLGENKKTLELARESIRLFTGKSDYYILAATAAHRLGRSKEAETILQEGISVFSEAGIGLSYPLYLALAQLYLELGEIKKSTEQVSLVLERAPENAEALAFREKLKNLK